MKYITLIAGMLALSACTMGHAPDAYLPSKNGIASGEQITVHGNENIYGIAREHNVSMRELIALNDLKPPFAVRPGQSLTLPAGGNSFAGDMKPPSPAPLDAVEKSSLNPIEPASVSSQSLEPIAAPPQASGSPQPLMGGSQPTALAPMPAPVTVPAPKAALQPQSLSEPVKDLNQPSVAQKQVATTTTSTTAITSASGIPAAAGIAAPAAAAAAAAAGTSGGEESGSLSMVWPVQGPIISTFGSKGAGLNNDGINIGAPRGAPVVAAAAGTIVYAGNEMKGFGNLVLIRHQGDWVTAYAHLDRVLVKKDNVVGQGDEIGTVGKSGNVTSPQLHFETRQSGKPVDPSGVIKSNG